MVVPLRCSDCGTIIKQKPRAKKPKYCGNCRQRRQDEWRNRQGK